jgi:neutral ceramidase
MVAPRGVYAVGQRVKVTFVGAHPGNDLHRGGTYLEVQRGEGPRWRTIADDGDWETRFLWRREHANGSEVTILWDIPDGTTAGTYRIRYCGEARDAAGALHSFTGISPAFAVSPAPSGGVQR